MVQVAPTLKGNKPQGFKGQMLSIHSLSGVPGAELHQAAPASMSRSGHMQCRHGMTTCSGGARSSCLLVLQ
jgi:hypothetical protein